MGGFGKGWGRWGDRGEAAEITFELFLCGVGRALQRLATYQATDTKSGVLIEAVGRGQVRRVQAQVVRVAVAERRPTPIVAVRAAIVRGRAIEVAGVKEIIREASKTITHNVASTSTALIATCTTISCRKDTIFFGGTITGW